jgi:hypothetical protein
LKAQLKAEGAKDEKNDQDQASRATMLVEEGGKQDRLIKEQVMIDIVHTLRSEDSPKRRTG